MQHTRWYKDCVFYQIWPRSFKDGNGDGFGDLYGVYDKLDYIKSLGCNAIWFSPLYPSPGVDCGYDISDYMDIAPEYGGLEAFKKVLDGAHARGMKVIMDLVVNHTSDEHEWFQKSRQRIEPYTGYYIWRPGKPGGRLPNNWDSHFEGKAWQWDEVRQEYYLHLFAVKQPDLNMDNPLVRAEVVKILRFWLDMGVDGFREDVITFISKKEGLPNDHVFPYARGILHYNFGPHLHEYLQQFRREAFDDYDCMTLAEAGLSSPEKCLEYTAESDHNDLDMFIQFDCMGADCLITDYIPLKFSLKKLKKAFTAWQEGLEGKGWNCLYLENHDHSRAVSRFGSEKYRAESAKMLCAAYMFQKGTPFVYQGQELGMTNWYPDSTEMYEDVQTRNKYRNLPEKLRLKIYYTASRDSARTPFPWTGGRNAGFTEGEKPWFSINPNYTEINCEDQLNDPDSVLNFYRKAIEMRKSLPCVRSGKYREHSKNSGKLYEYTMTGEGQQLHVFCSFSQDPVEIRIPVGADLILANYENPSSVLKPYECRVYLS